MNQQQFRVLYREFLFRMVDLEVLSSHAQGDMNKLFGQFASLLVMVSLLLCMLALISGQMGRTTPIRWSFCSSSPPCWWLDCSPC